MSDLYPDFQFLRRSNLNFFDYERLTGPVSDGSYISKVGVTTLLCVWGRMEEVQASYLCK